MPKMRQNTFGAGLRPDPLGELERSPSPLATMRGPTSKGRGGEIEGREGDGSRGEEKGEEGTRRRNGPPLLDHVYAPVNVNHIFIALLGKYIIDEPQVEIISQLHLVRLKCD